MFQSAYEKPHKKYRKTYHNGIREKHLPNLKFGKKKRPIYFHQE